MRDSGNHSNKVQPGVLLKETETTFGQQLYIKIFFKNGHSITRSNSKYVKIK